MDLTFELSTIDFTTHFMPDPMTGSYNLTADSYIQENMRHITCDSNQGLNMMCNANIRDGGVNYPGVSLQKIEIDNDKHVVNMKLKVADKDSSAIKQSASACKFKVK